MKDAWILNISRFKNVGQGHVYGSIRRLRDSKFIIVESMLTDEWAAALNALESDFEYHSGVLCERFLDVESCRQSAIRIFQENAETGDVLYDYDVTNKDPIATKTVEKDSDKAGGEA